jgi:hypothetical protein
MNLGMDPLITLSSSYWNIKGTLCPPQSQNSSSIHPVNSDINSVHINTRHHGLRSLLQRVQECPPVCHPSRRCTGTASGHKHCWSSSVLDLAKVAPLEAAALPKTARLSSTPTGVGFTKLAAPPIVILAMNGIPLSARMMLLVPPIAP